VIQFRFCAARAARLRPSIRAEKPPVAKLL